MFILKFFFIFILIILLFVAVFVFSIAFRMWDAIRVMMGKEPRRSSFNAYTNQWANAQEQSTTQDTSSSQSTQTKISGGKPRNSTIDKNEGEYVDFEVIES